jgi:macrolide-specific efflux system membrane fusion protein
VAELRAQPATWAFVPALRKHQDSADQALNWWGFTGAHAVSCSDLATPDPCPAAGRRFCSCTVRATRGYVVTAPIETQAVSETAPPTAQVEGSEEERKSSWWRGWTRRRLLALGLVVVLVVVAVLITWLLTRQSSSSASAAPLAVTTEKVTVGTGTIKQTVSASGTIEPASQAQLSFAVSGQVTAVDVLVGQKVTSGQTLATVGTTALQDEVNAASETLASAQSRLSSDESSDASTSQIESDEATVTSAQSQVNSAKQNLADANLTSTISGTVASVDLTVGQAVSSGSGSSGSGSNSANSTNSALSNASSSASSSSSSSSTASAQIVVVSTDAYNVDTTVDDTQVGQVKVGDQVTIAPSGSSATVYGTVSSVGLVAESSDSGSSSVASFPVVVAVTGTPSGLYAGTSATLTITTEQLSNVVEVPTSAISYANGQTTVTKVVRGSQISQAVTTGVAASGETQITSGLKAGDMIIERVVKFNGTAGSGSRSLLGGSGSSTRTGGGLPGGGFPTGRFTGGGGGFPGGGSGG